MKRSKHYNMSFTAGNLCFSESIIVAEVYDELGNWINTKKRVLEDNLLQAHRMNSAVRIYREVEARLRNLTEEELGLFLSGSRFEKLCMLWVAVCKRHKLIYEFAKEVVREKYLHLDMLVTHQDFDRFYRDKAEWHEELERLAGSTRNKIRQVLFMIMKQAGIISEEGIINPFVLNREVVMAIIRDDKSLLAAFPISERDVKAVLDGDKNG
ncbi:MAG TPA: DUF1819 family protein [Candidatus Krumholzibacteriaceae bacterium]|nr:DUF1819 family protein [Candidatus Krumholzibacteriaceae bacterium]